MSSVAKGPLTARQGERVALSCCVVAAAKSAQSATPMTDVEAHDLLAASKSEWRSAMDFLELITGSSQL